VGELHAHGLAAQHTKLKLYFVGILVGYMKICTNENFLQYNNYITAQQIFNIGYEKSMPTLTP
jgi:hypothetical protein